MQALEIEKEDEYESSDEVSNETVSLTKNENDSSESASRRGNTVTNLIRQRYYSNMDNIKFCEACWGFTWLFCSSHPRLGWCFTLILVYLLLVFVTDIWIHNHQKKHKDSYLWSMEKSTRTNTDPLTYYNNSSTKTSIKKWCLDDNDESCTCQDPFEPSSKVQYKNWKSAFRQNKRLIKDSFCHLHEQDVVFIGESVVEMMIGRYFGNYFTADENNNNNKTPEISPELAQFAAKVHSKFEEIINHNLDTEKKKKTKRSSDSDSQSTDHSHNENANHGSIALGIGGDTSPNVLYRLQHGEMPECLQPKIYWIVLGMNDLARKHCSEHVTLLGIVAVIQKIRSLRPNTPIVINSILPMTDVRKDDLMNAFQDAVTTKENDDQNRYLEENMDLDRMDEQQQYEKQVNKDEARPILNQLEEQDINMFLHPIAKYHQKRHPLWPHVQVINQALNRFVKIYENIYFFDASPIFLTQDRKHLNTQLISLRGHPTALGYEKWFKVMKASFPQYINPQQQQQQQQQKQKNEEKKTDEILRKHRPKRDRNNDRIYNENAGDKHHQSIEEPAQLWNRDKLHEFVNEAIYDEWNQDKLIKEGQGDNVKELINRESEKIINATVEEKIITNNPETEDVDDQTKIDRAHPHSKDPDKPKKRNKNPEIND